MRYDKGLVGSEVDVTEEGYIKGRCIVTRCGVFFYKNADGSVRSELRHPDDVSEDESLQSMKMIPVVDGHPPEKLINAENSKRLSVGYTGQEVEENYPYVIANMVITDKATVQKVKEKKRNQLSLGYTVDLIPEKGAYNGEPYEFRQTNIRYNHLALVDEARAGPEAKIALDGLDAESVEINKIGVNNMASKKQRKIKFDDTHEYMVDDEVGKHMEKMMSHKMELEHEKESLERKIEELHNMIDKTTAERDSMRDKDHHNPHNVHEPFAKPEETEEDHHLAGEEDDESEEERDRELAHAREMKKKEHPEHEEEDEIGPNGKEKMDPYDSYGMQSHVRDIEKPSKMESHVVHEPKNKRTPHDLPHVAKVDEAEFRRRVNDRVKLQTLAQRYVDKDTVQRLDSLSDIEIKKKLILSIQKKANLDGKSAAYINARFDSVIEDLPREKVIATPSRTDANFERDTADATQARQNMIRRQKEAYKLRSK